MKFKNNFNLDSANNLMIQTAYFVPPRKYVDVTSLVSTQAHPEEIRAPSSPRGDEGSSVKEALISSG
jgi:hypothetical protein